MNYITEQILTIFFLLIVNLLANFLIIHLIFYFLKKFRKEIKDEKIWMNVVIITIICLIADYALFFLLGEPNLNLSAAIIVCMSGIVSYFLLFRNRLKKQQAILASVLFSIISNPLWLFAPRHF